MLKIIASSEKLNGVFSYFRSKAVLDKYVKLTSPQFHFSETYCTIYKGRDIYSLVDGNTTTAWTNNNHGLNESNFIVHFKRGRLQLTSYTFSFACLTPKAWTIEGSNDGINYKIIDEKKQSVEDHSTMLFNTLNNEAFKYFRFQQLENTNPIQAEKHRFHLREIELFGTFETSSMNTCTRKYYSHRLLYSFSILLLSYLTNH